MDEAILAELRCKLARMFGDDVAQEALLATWQKGDAVTNFEHYATRAARRFMLMGVRRDKGVRMIEIKPTYARIEPEQHRRLEAREALRSCDPRLISAALEGRVLTATERSIRFRMKGGS